MQATITCPMCGHDTVVSSMDQRVPCPSCGQDIAVPRLALAPGVLLGEDYRLERRLGRASLGTTWTARQLSLGRTVRVLILSEQRRHDPEALARFQREVRLTAGLEHPHLLRAFAAGTDGDLLFLVTDHVEGTTLEELLERRGQIPESEARPIFAQLAGALAHAWESRQLLHRNLKPRTILIGEDGQAHLTDLGIARSLADEGPRLTGLDVALGSPAYMSPEQCQATDLDARSDMYAFGCVLYHALAGAPPFATDDVVALMQKQMREPHPPLGLRAEVSDDTAALIDRLLAKDPDERPDTWSEVADQLAAKPPTAASPSAAKPKPRRSAPPPAPVATPALDAVTTAPRGGFPWPWVLAGLLILVGLWFAWLSKGLPTATTQVADVDARAPGQPPVSGETATSAPATPVTVPRPQVGGGPPRYPSAAEIAANREAATRRSWEVAEAHRRAHPEDTATLLNMYRLIARQGGESPYVDQAAHMIAQLEEQQRQAGAESAHALQARFEALVKAEQFEEADALVEEFPESRRRELRAHLEREQAATAERLAHAQARAQDLAADEARRRREAENARAREERLCEAAAEAAAREAAARELLAGMKYHNRLAYKIRNEGTENERYMVYGFQHTPPAELRERIAVQITIYDRDMYGVPANTPQFRVGPWAWAAHDKTYLTWMRDSFRTYREWKKTAIARRVENFQKELPALPKELTANEQRRAGSGQALMRPQIPRLLFQADSRADGRYRFIHLMPNAWGKNTSTTVVDEKAAEDQLKLWEHTIASLPHFLSLYRQAKAAAEEQDKSFR